MSLAGPIPKNRLQVKCELCFWRDQFEIAISSRRIGISARLTRLIVGA